MVKNDKNCKWLHYIYPGTCKWMQIVDFAGEKGASKLSWTTQIIMSNRLDFQRISNWLIIGHCELWASLDLHRNCTWMITIKQSEANWWFYFFIIVVSHIYIHINQIINCKSMRTESTMPDLNDQHNNIYILMMYFWKRFRNKLCILNAEKQDKTKQTKKKKES